MRYIAQLDSGLADFNFGDCGYAYGFLCKVECGSTGAAKVSQC